MGASGCSAVRSDPSFDRHAGDPRALAVAKAPERKLASMSKSPDKDTSITLMMRVQQDPADPQGLGRVRPQATSR